MNTTLLGPRQDVCLVFQLKDTKLKFMLLQTENREVRICCVCKTPKTPKGFHLKF